MRIGKKNIQFGRYSLTSIFDCDHLVEIKILFPIEHSDRIYIVAYSNLVMKWVHQNMKISQVER